MRQLILGLSLALAVAGVAPLQAEERHFAFGGDQYVAGQVASFSGEVARDAFAAGYDVTAQAVSGDAHLAGYNITTQGAIAGNLYAAGSTLTVMAPVGGDVTAIAQTLAVREGGTVAGNLRAAAALVTLAAPVSGSVLVSAQTLKLEGTITGDLSFFGDTLSFGPDARVSGQLLIQAPRQIEVPASVASPDRVTYTALVVPDYATEAGKTAEHVVRSVWPAVWATGLWWVLLMVVGLLFITLANRFVLAMERAATRRPLRNFGLGILAFATLLGLVPVLGLTVAGLVALPFVLMFVAICWALAYVAGTYLVALRVGAALVPIDNNLKRLGVLIAGILVAGLIGMVPILGWLTMLVLTGFGFGAFALLTMLRWSARDQDLLQPATAS